MKERGKKWRPSFVIDSLRVLSVAVRSTQPSSLDRRRNQIHTHNPPPFRHYCHSLSAAPIRVTLTFRVHLGPLVFDTPIHKLLPLANMATELPEPTDDIVKRPTTSYSTLPELSKPFLIDPAQRSYKHQYANIYFVRLVELRPIVEKHALARWSHIRGEQGESAACPR